MKEIVEAKVAQVPAFKDALQKSHSKTVFVETTLDNFWGSGLNKTGTLKTKASKWPGNNTLGRIIGEVAKVHRRTTRSWSVPRNASSAKKAPNQREITTMLQDLRSPRKRSRSGRRRPSPDQGRDRDPEDTDTGGSEQE